MKREELLAWVGGHVSAKAVFAVLKEDGPNKEYYSISLCVPSLDGVVYERLMHVNHNGTIIEGDGWQISGRAAVRGFLREVWKYLTPTFRAQANDVLREHKEKNART